MRLSDQTQLTNFSGDKKAWLVYVIIGNILSRMQISATKRPILPLPLLPVSRKLRHESVHSDEIQQQMNADALQAVFVLILAPLQEIDNDGAVMACAEGNRAYVFQSYPPGLPTSPSIPY